MPQKNGNGKAWGAREKILLSSGLLLIFLVAVATTLFDKPFHLELVLAGLALCGVSIAQVGDKK